MSGSGFSLEAVEEVLGGLSLPAGADQECVFMVEPFMIFCKVSMPGPSG